MMITTTSTIKTRNGMVSASAELIEGKVGEVRLTIDTKGRGSNQLFVKDFEQLSDIALTIQELQKAVTEGLG